MKHKFINLTIIVLISMSTVGCSALRLIETRAGYAVKKTVQNTEERRTPLTRKDFALQFNTTGSEVSCRLEYRPYYRLETRDLVTYTPNSPFVRTGKNTFSPNISTAETLVALVTVGLWAWALIDNQVETGEVAINDKGERSNVTTLDWEGATPLQKAIMIGVPVDATLWVFASFTDMKVQEPWKRIDEVPGEWELLANHPYRIELPTHNFGKEYLARYGYETIPISEFLSGIKNPAPFREIDSVSLRASTEFDGKPYVKTIRLTTPAQLQPFRDTALVALGVDMISIGKPRLMPRAEAIARWGKSAVQGGDTATLRVTVENTGKGTLYRLTATTVSANPTFNNQELKFGKIVPGESKTMPISFQTDKLMRTREIPIRLQFAEYNAHVPAEIDAKLHIIEKPRPRFDYAYRIVDGSTATSIGNGDGIIQRGESVDIRVTIRNSGEGSATGVTAKLDLPGGTKVDMYGDDLVNLGTLAPGDSKTATFNVGIKKRSSVDKLRLNLFVKETNFGSETQLTETLNFPIYPGSPARISVVDLVGTITANSAQARSGATHDTPISAEIPRNSHVNISGQLGEWYRIELQVRNQKLTGWIHEEQITTEQGSTQPGSQGGEGTVVEVFQNTPPTLTLFEPKQRDIEVEDSTLVIQAIAVANKGVKNVELTVNGRKRNIAIEGRNATQTVFRIEEHVRLNYGENTIKLNAYDTNNQASEPIVLSVTREREQVRNDYALLFGVNSYEHFDPWHKLNNPIPDAETIRDELKNRYGFAVELVSDATRDEILTKINEYAQKQYNENDQLLIFFAGHGYFEETNDVGIGYLVASDTMPPDADRGKSSYISHGDLRERIDNIGCEHIFLMIDACFSGTFDPLVAQFNRARGANRIPDDVSRSKYIKQTLTYKTRLYLTSGGKEYVSDGTPNRHSPFTRRVLDALRSGRGQHGILTLNDIRRYLEKATPQPRAGEFGTNAPGSNFLFIRK